MPHIIVEYSKSLEPRMSRLLGEMHNMLAEKGIDKTRIKTRGIAVEHAHVGEHGTQGQMMHATLLLLAGRDLETKKKYGGALHTLMKQTAPDDCAVTLEIRDMDPESYYL
ncbi:MAG: hypothetical protein H6855_03515 [Rhodospirillales bacterium]|nr:hypothetical protein [Rhodospirillales bacterium]MCB9979589.1 hypothetical protein [Rhodospirillales bacterium]